MDKIPQSLFSIADLFQHTPISGVLLLFIVIAPVVVGCVLYVLNQLLKLTQKQRRYIAVATVLLLAGGITWLKFAQLEVDKYRYAESQVIDYLQANRMELVSFQYLKDSAGLSYSSSFYKDLAYFSDSLVLVKMYKPKDVQDSLGLRYRWSHDIISDFDKRKIIEEKLVNTLQSRTGNAIGFQDAQKLIGNDLTLEIFRTVINRSPRLGFVLFKKINDSDATDGAILLNPLDTVKK